LQITASKSPNSTTSSQGKNFAVVAVVAVVVAVVVAAVVAVVCN